jgi:hypothetical protein
LIRTRKNKLLDLKEQEETKQQQIQHAKSNIQKQNAVLANGL